MGLFVLLVALVIAAAGMLPGLSIGPSLDASVFSTVGWRLAGGDLLYTATWDHKPPGNYAAHWLAHSLASDPHTSWLITWSLTVVCIAVTAYAVWAILSETGRTWSAAISSLLVAWVLSNYLLTLGGGLGESFGTVPASLAIVVAATTRQVPWRWLVVGGLIAIAGVVSLQTIPAVAAVAVLGWSADLRIVARRAGVVALGGSIILAVAAVPLVVGGTLGAAIDALVAYSAAYQQEVAAGGGAAGSPPALLPWVFLLLVPLVVPAAMGLLQGRRDAFRRRLLLASAAWLGAGVILIAIQGRLYGHYVIPLVVPLGLMAGIGLELMRRRLPRRRAGPVLLIAPMAAALALAMVVGAAGAPMEQRWIRDSNERAAQVAPVVADLVAPGETIFVWGNEPRLYELADRAPATRWIYLYPLLTAGYATPERIAEVRAELAAAPPGGVIDAGSPGPGEPGMPPLLIDRPVSTDGRDQDLLDPLRAFIRENYELAGIVDGWPVYRANRGE